MSKTNYFPYIVKGKTLRQLQRTLIKIRATELETVLETDEELMNDIIRDSIEVGLERLDKAFTDKMVDIMRRLKDASDKLEKMKITK